MTAYEQLTDAHRIFVDAYVDSLNYRHAYQQMFPDVSYNTARTEGSNLASREYIRKAIIERLQQRSIDKTETLERIIQVIRFDVTDYLNKSFVLDVDKMNADGYGWLIKGYKKGKVLEIMLMDKDRALENLAKIHQLFDDKQQLTVNIQQEISAKDQLVQKLEELDTKLQSYDGGK